MASLIFQHPTDQKLSASVTITPSSEDASYPKAGLYDSNPAKPFKFTATTGNIVFDFGSATSLDLVAIIHHNLTAALANVKIQGNATDAWGAPSLDQAITIPAYEQDGFPVNPWLDLSGIGSRSFRYWRLSFGTANAAIIQLGQVWLGGTKRSLTKNIQWGFQESADRRIIEHETDYGVATIYDLGSKVLSWEPTIITTAAGLTEFKTWWDACHGRALPTLVILDPAVNESRLVRWSQPVRTVEHRYANVKVIQFGLREVSRGLVL